MFGRKLNISKILIQNYIVSTNREVVLQLLRKALDHSWRLDLPEGIDWDRVLALANEQCVTGICLEAMEQLPVGLVPKVQLLQWIGQTEMQRGQYQFAWNVACKLDKMWAAEGIQTTVLKGRSISQYYTVPYHRYSCDLDVFIEHGWDKACELLESNGLQLSHEVYKEVEFTMDEVYVECHRYITPLRGNKLLQSFERYLRSLLNSEQTTLFDGTTLICPPLIFNVMLYVEHALGDFLHGHLTLKEIVDWVVLRKQGIDRESIGARCKEYKFDRFLKLIDSLADVIEGKTEYNSLSPEYRKAFDDVFMLQGATKSHSWFRRRVDLFLDIVKNEKKFRDYGYMSMPAFLFNSVWTHFFDKEVKL